MKQKFNKNWKSSKQPRKQRKYLAKAPLHIRIKFVGANLSKDLRKKHNRRSVAVRKNDVVKIMRGKFKNKQGKVLKVNSKKSKVFIEGITIRKMDGSKVEVSIPSSKIQIVELNLDDKKRIRDKKNKEEAENKLKKEKNAP
ncbi:MAG: 50S ribosomal protein L24 [Nanoarchaeota archaeon]